LTEQFGSSVSRQVLKTMQLAGDAADCIDHLAADWSGQPPFGQLSVAVQRQVLRRQLFGLGDEPTFDLVESLRLKAGRIIEVSSGRRLQRNAAGKVDVAVEEPEFLLAKREVSLSGKAGETEFGGLKIQWERLSGGFDKWRELGQMNNREVFNAASIGQSITLRHWQPGDRYKPIGQAGTTKLQDLFVNQKIPKPERRGLVVAEDANGQLFWVQKLRIADSGKVTGSTRELLLLSW
ncbi:MAG: tRNA lysidine(34) synthetase TilS, partial [Verrucomicrobiota bacterium]|nr:tRNA lysidine(34) synthetase TilS [Verrucomicrobiota bacterium]